MSENEAHAVNAAAPRRWRRLGLAFGGAFIACALVLALLPYGLEKGAVSWLQQHGVDDARIDNIDLNLFSGEAVLQELKSGDGLQIDHLSIAFDWLPLWHHIVHIRTLKLGKSSLHMLESNGIWQVAGISADENNPSAPSEENSDGHDPWQVVVDDLVLDAVDVRVKSSLFTLSLPLKSMRLSLSGLEHQRLINRIAVGHTAFSGFGYDVSITGAKLEGDVGFSILSDDILASIKSNKLSLDLQGVKLRSEHDKRRISAASLKLDGIAPAGGDHIRIASLALNAIGIDHALDDQGGIKLGSVAVNGINVGSDGAVSVAKLIVKDAGADGASGLRQSLHIVKASLADFAWTAAKHLRIGSLDLNTVKMAHVMKDGLVELKHLHFANMDVEPDGNMTVSKLTMKGVNAGGFSGVQQSLQIGDVSLANAAWTAAKHIRIGSLDLNTVDVVLVMNDGMIALKHLHLTKLDAGSDGDIVVATLGLQALQAEEGMPDKHILRMETANLAGLNIHPGSRVAVASLDIRNGDIRKPQASAPGGMQLLGAFEQASLKQFQMRGNDSGSFEWFKLDKVQLPVVDGKSMGSIGAIQTIHAELDQTGTYHVRQMKVDQLHAHLVKRKSGWILPATGQQPQPSAHRDASKASAGDKSRDKRPRVLIDEVEVGAGSRMDLRDETVSPVLQTSIQIQRFHFAPLDSSGQQRGKLDALLKLGESGSLSARGTLSPAPGERFFADLKIALKNLDLPSLSGYVEADLGKPIKTGQMNLDSDVRIENNAIDSKNHILIRKLQLGDVAKSENADQQLSLAGGMSIDMALGMLQNDRGDVDLDVPVKGPLDDPDINLSHIINKALLTSLKTGAMTYAALALQPYGTIILVADVAAGLIKDAVKPTLTPIVFAERKSTLSPQMTDYIAKIAALMQKKDFRLEVCGIATRIEGEQIIHPATGTAPGQIGSFQTEPNQTAQPVYTVEPALDDEQLLALAGKRAALIIDALHARSIAENRLFNCRASIDETKAQANPRVELLLD